MSMTEKEGKTKERCLPLDYKLEKLFHWRVRGDTQLLPLMNNSKHKALSF